MIIVHKITGEKINILLGDFKHYPEYRKATDEDLTNNPPIVLTPVQQKRKALVDYFDSFYPELKAFFKPAKDASLEYFDREEYENAIRVIEKYPLPSETFVNDEGQEENYKNYIQEIINILKGE